MPKISYQTQRFNRKSQLVIDKANEIIEEYAAQGYDLTLRQLYYQFVSRDLVANTQKEYKRLGSIINNARLAGLIDWDRVVDRTRNLHKQPTWDSPQEIINACADQFRLDKWVGQTHRVEVWIEKEALAGVFERVCDELQVPFFSCRGYNSQSEMWSAGMRLKAWEKRGYTPVVLHFGDHDPSGLDMTRDIRERLAMFMGEVTVERLALTIDQVDQYAPPPNPAKETDIRFAAYQGQFGDESWELDALEPDVLAALVRDRVAELLDETAWDRHLEAEEKHKREIGLVAGHWKTIVKNLKK